MYITFLFSVARISFQKFLFHYFVKVLCICITQFHLNQISATAKIFSTEIILLKNLNVFGHFQFDCLKRLDFFIKMISALTILAIAVLWFKTLTSLPKF